MKSKTIKRILIVLFLFIFTLSLASCNNSLAGSKKVNVTMITNERTNHVKTKIDNFTISEGEKHGNLEMIKIGKDHVVYKMYGEEKKANYEKFKEEGHVIAITITSGLSGVVYSSKICGTYGT